MRVKISYGVEISEVPTELEQLFDYVYDRKSKLDSQLELVEKLLEEKQLEIERLKRSNQQWQKEVDRLGSKTSVPPVPAPIKRPVATSRFNRRLSVNSPQKQDTEWLSNQLDTKLKHFDEIR